MLKAYNHSLTSHLNCLRNQRQSQLCALANLNRHQTSKLDIFGNFETFFQPLLSNFKYLLEIFESTLSLLGKIRVLQSLQPFTTANSNGMGRRTVSETSTTVTGPAQHGRTASGSTNAVTVRERFLIDFVNVERIREIKNRCQDVYGKFKPHKA